MHMYIHVYVFVSHYDLGQVAGHGGVVVAELELVVVALVA